MRKILFSSAVMVLVVFVLAGAAFALPVVNEVEIEDVDILQISTPSATNDQGVVQVAHAYGIWGQMALNNNAIPQWNIQDSTNNAAILVDQDAPVGVSVEVDGYVGEYNYIEAGLEADLYAWWWWTAVGGGLDLDAYLYWGSGMEWGTEIDVDLEPFANEAEIEDITITQTNSPTASNSQAVNQTAAAANGVAINNNSTSQANIQNADNNVMIGVNQGFTPVP
ncbi:MAG TPA: hypothetical protein VLH40_03345 [Atribacteraceae bacterium]|nr:hypothetical protein [Atribacteraceae bacterium]